MPRPRRNINPPARLGEQTAEQEDDSSHVTIMPSTRQHGKKEINTISYEDIGANSQKRALPSAAFPSLQWPRAPKRQKPGTHLVVKQDSASPALDLAHPAHNSPSKTPELPRERKYPGNGVAGHGIPLILDLHTDASFDWRAARKEKKVVERKARYEKYMTPDARQMERQYRAWFAAETKKVRLYGPTKVQQMMRQSNITDSPRDRFWFEEEMATSSEDEAEDVRDEGEQFKQLHITLQHAIIIEIEEDVENLVEHFPASSKNFASRTLLHITSNYISQVCKEKCRLVAEDDQDAMLVKDQDISEAKKFLNTNDLPPSLIKVHDPDQD